MITVFINGQPREIPAGQSVDALLALLALPLDRVAVELDRSIVRKRDWSNARIADGAHLEIVEFVGGG